MSRNFGYELFQVLIILAFAFILFFKVGNANAGDRKQMRVDDGGIHYTLLDPGECDNSGCVMYEKFIGVWDGGAPFIHQFFDTDGDDVCDSILVWKPLEDPTWGTFYALMKSTTCMSVI
jgi:hypothetical protein